MFSAFFGKKKSLEEGSKKQSKSLDTKKGAEPPPLTRPAAQKNDAAQSEIARSTAKKINQIETEMSLDFIATKPNAAKDKNAISATQPIASIQSNRPNVLPPLDSSSSLILGDTINAMALEISASAAAPMIEEVAILYANGQSIAAINVLLAAIKEDQLEGATNQAWLMLFELYQLLDKKAEFQNLTLDYVAKFASPPPDWQDPDAENVSPTHVVKAAPKESNVAVFAPLLDERVIDTLQQIKKMGERSSQIKVDFSHINKLTLAGCTMLLKLFPALKKSGHVLTMIGVDSLVTLLLLTIQPGRRDPSDAAWILLLEMYRVLNKESEFEEKSIEYCTTFELSPPSWEGVPSHLRISNEAPTELVTVQPTVIESFKLHGDIHGNAEAELSELTAYAAEQTQINIDCSDLKRVDFAAGSAFLNTLVVLVSSGKKIEIHEVNQLVAALFVIMGIHELALINVKRRV